MMGLSEAYAWLTGASKDGPPSSRSRRNKGVESAIQDGDDRQFNDEDPLSGGEEDEFDDNERKGVYTTKHGRGEDDDFSVTSSDRYALDQDIKDQIASLEKSIPMLTNILGGLFATYCTPFFCTDWAATLLYAEKEESLIVRYDAILDLPTWYFYASTWTKHAWSFLLAGMHRP